MGHNKHVPTFIQVLVSHIELFTYKYTINNTESIATGQILPYKTQKAGKIYFRSPMIILGEGLTSDSSGNHSTDKQY